MRNGTLTAVFVVASLLSHNLLAKNEPKRPPGFKLLNKDCVTVEGEPPILLSEIENRAKVKGLSFAEAQSELITERLLWVYAKKQLKYNINEIIKATDEHINKVMEKNKLSQARFEELLMQAPYFSTFKQYRLETQTAMLENSVKSSIASQVSITDAQVIEEARKNKAEGGGDFEVVFISILPIKTGNKTLSSLELNAQIKKANEIRSQIASINNLSEVKKRYGDKANISIIGPISYETGTLKKEYEERLKASKSAKVTEAFSDDGAVTIIWKIAKPIQKSDGTALEKVRKEIYERVVMDKYKAVIGAMMDVSTVKVKRCSKR